MFDPKCEELAKHFLDDRDATPEQIQDLADEIQDLIEDWMSRKGLA
jgi:hypothetical protein